MCAPSWYQPGRTSASRIDWFFLSEAWAAKWPNLTQSALPRKYSDHCPLLLEDDSRDWGPKPFRVLDSWFQHADYENFVQTAWLQTVAMGTGGFIYQQKMKQLRERLRTWNHQVFGRIPTRIMLLEGRINEYDILMEGRSLTEAEISDKKQLVAEMVKLSKIQANILFQKSRSKWLAEDDANSSYFHATLRKNRSKNTVKGMLIDGNWITEVAQVKKHIHESFQSHYAVGTTVRPRTQWVLDQTLTTMDSEQMIAPFTEEEVLMAVKSCGNRKSPGPDGFNFRFIKHFWHLLKDPIMQLFGEFWEDSRLVKGLNATFVALAPKIANPQHISNFRPISVVNSLYKILSKVLAGRLKRVLPTLISQNQSSFVPNRYIMDSVLVANEVLHEAKTSKKKCTLFKVDFEKAFDSVDWRYLFDLMKSMGFHTKWLSWINSCVTTAQLSIVVNGSPCGEFQMQRGLRQGCSLSPMLFAIATKGLNVMLTRARTCGELKGYEIGRQRVPITHQQYADDTIIFGNGSTHDTVTIKRVLLLFEAASGLKVNYHKSKLYTMNIRHSAILRHARILQCRTESIPFKYLGVSVGSNPRKRETWRPVVQVIENRLSGWETKYISQGGRLVLLKSVVASIPLFYFSIYKAPNAVLKKITSMLRKFLWGGKLEGNRRINWISWEDICHPIDRGGLGIKSLQEFNYALLAKWGYRLMTLDDTFLWKTVIDSLYGDPFIPNHMLSYSQGGNSRDSIWWKDLRDDITTSSWFATNFRRKIGGGHTTLFWKDVWLGDYSFEAKFPELYAAAADKYATIAQKGSFNTHWSWQWLWSENYAEEEFLQLAMLLIDLAQAPAPTSEPDTWVWNNNVEQAYSTKNAYNQLMQSKWRIQTNQFDARRAWNRMIPSKICFFIWRLLNHRLPTRRNLHWRGMQLPDINCPLCSEAEETETHLFRECRITKQYLMMLYNWLDIPEEEQQQASHSDADGLQLHMQLQQPPWTANSWKSVWQIAVWQLWRGRNRLIFQHEPWTSTEILDRVKMQLWLIFQQKRLIHLTYSFGEWIREPKHCF